MFVLFVHDFVFMHFSVAEADTFVVLRCSVALDSHFVCLGKDATTNVCDVHFIAPPPLCSLKPADDYV